MGGNLYVTQTKLIATDIDGTLFDDDKNYNIERLNNYPKALHQQGIQFAVASGNNYDHLKRIFQRTPQIDLFIAENGAQIVKKGETIYEREMPKTLVNDMIPTLFNQLDLKSLSLSGKKASYAESKKDLPLYHMKNLVIVDNLLKINDDIFKFNIQLQHDDLTEAIKFLNDNYGQEIYAAVSGFGSIDIMRNNVNKSIALRHLCDLEDFSLKNVMAFGDNLNDLEMIQSVGTGIAMKNAKAQVIKVANLVTNTDNNHDGVLNTINEIFKLDK